MIDIKIIREQTLKRKMLAFEYLKQTIETKITEESRKGISKLYVSPNQNMFSDLNMLSDKETECLMKYFKDQGFNISDRGKFCGFDIDWK